jgi:hypothetical protein
MNNNSDFFVSEQTIPMISLNKQQFYFKIHRYSGIDDDHLYIKYHNIKSIDILTSYLVHRNRFELFDADYDRVTWSKGYTIYFLSSNISKRYQVFVELTT